MRKVTDNCVKIAVEFECSGDVSRYLRAYICPAKKVTIGIGTTIYPNGEKVRMGHVITEDQAYAFYMLDIMYAEKEVDEAIKSNVLPHQFDACVDFAYNKGVNAFKTSKLLRLINANPNDPRIDKAFMSWVYGGDGTKNGKDDDLDGLIDEPGEKQRLSGLIRRSKCWSHLYFHNELNFFRP